MAFRNPGTPRTSPAGFELPLTLLFNLGGRPEGKDVLPVDVRTDGDQSADAFPRNKNLALG